MSDTPHRVRIGMVGGGPGAGIAESHRMGIRMDGRFDLVAGVFSRDPDKSAATARRLAIDPARAYTSFEEMAEREAERDDGIEVVSVVTPNESHFAVSRAFLDRGIHVVCDKPLTDNLDDAVALHRLALKRQRLMVLTHNYSAYAMVREAADMVRKGVLGEIRMVQAEHASGWAAGRVEEDAGNKQAAWRTDPDQAGRESMLLDLGTHVHHMVRFVSGLEIESLSAELHTVVPGRRVYDDANVLTRYSNGARGSLWITMAATGQEHGLRFRLIGERASLEWRHEAPGHLYLRHVDGRCEILAQGSAALGPEAAALTRVGLGHPEGFPASFANLYRNVADEIEARREGRHDESAPRLPDSRDGVMGLAFVNAVLASADADGRWVSAAAPLAPSGG